MKFDYCQEDGVAGGAEEKNTKTKKIFFRYYILTAPCPPGAQ